MRRPRTWSSFWVLAFWTDNNKEARPGGDFAHLHVAPFQRGSGFTRGNSLLTCLGPGSPIRDSGNVHKQRCGPLMGGDGKENSPSSSPSKGFKHSWEDVWSSVLTAELTCLPPARGGVMGKAEHHPVNNDSAFSGRRSRVRGSGGASPDVHLIHVMSRSSWAPLKSGRSGPSAALCFAMMPSSCPTLSGSAAQRPGLEAPLLSHKTGMRIPSAVAVGLWREPWEHRL